MSIPQKLGISEHDFRLVFGRTKINYDLNKEEANRRWHGYSLESAVSLLERILMPWGTNVPHIIIDASERDGEVRHVHLSVDDCGDVVLMVTTMRPDETVRIVSFRRASDKEREQFRQNTGYARSRDEAR